MSATGNLWQMKYLQTVRENTKLSEENGRLQKKIKKLKKKLKWQPVVILEPLDEPLPDPRARLTAYEEGVKRSKKK